MSEAGVIRTVSLTKVSIGTHVALAAGKIILGIVSLSLFWLASAGYNLSIAMAKCNALAGIQRIEDSGEQRRACAAIGGLVLTAGLLYMGFSVRMFIAPSLSRFTLHIAILVALFTFAEIAMSVWNLAKAAAYKQEMPAMYALRLTTLATSIICLAMTQNALLSAAYRQIDACMANGVVGILFGGCAALIGLHIVTDAHSGIRYRGKQTGIPLAEE